MVQEQVVEKQEHQKASQDQLQVQQLLWQVEAEEVAMQPSEATGYLLDRVAQEVPL